MTPTTQTRRQAALTLTPERFREMGHALVDQLATLLAQIPAGPVTPGESPAEVRNALGLTGPLPEHGADPGVLLTQTAERLFAHSLFNGHLEAQGFDNALERRAAKRLQANTHREVRIHVAATAATVGSAEARSAVHCAWAKAS